MLKAEREKYISYLKEKPIQMASYFSIETLKVIKTWNNAFTVFKHYYDQPSLIQPENLIVMI